MVFMWSQLCLKGASGAHFEPNLPLIFYQKLRSQFYNMRGATKLLFGGLVVHHSTTKCPHNSFVAPPMFENRLCNFSEKSYCIGYTICVQKLQNQCNMQKLHRPVPGAVIALNTSHMMIRKNSYTCMQFILGHWFCVTRSLSHSTTRTHWHLSLTLSLTHSLNQSLIHSVTHSLTHSLTHSIAQSLTHSLARSLIHLLSLCVCVSLSLSPAYPLTYSLALSLTHSLNRSLTQSLTGSLTDSLTLSLSLCLSSSLYLTLPLTLSLFLSLSQCLDHALSIYLSPVPTLTPSLGTPRASHNAGSWSSMPSPSSRCSSSWSSSLSLA